MQPVEAVKVVNVSKSYTDHQDQVKHVLNGISFYVEKGEIVSLLGKSGCGKSTLLNIIGGFEQPTEGQVLLDGHPVKSPSRQCIMLFQNYGLLPWRSVLKNVELGLEQLELSKQERRERAIEYLELVGLGDQLDQFPHQLSGGMQQRVALARALAMRPKLILMDEPFAALDTFTRYHLQNELLRIQEQEHTTIVLVTHDIDEAVYLSDRVIMLGSNTGQVARMISIPLSKPRDRGSGDFQYYRKLILQQFEFNEPNIEEEYSI